MSTLNAVLNRKNDIAMVESSEVHLETASAPAVQLQTIMPKPLLKSKISAPSYLFSLKENDMPPFQKPDREVKPKLLIGNVITEHEVIMMVAAHDDDRLHGVRKYLGELLVEKKIIVNYNITEKNFLISLLSQTIDYAAQRDFNAFKLSVLITIYLSVHMYFKWYYWLPPVSIWLYFKELMIRHTIEDSPDGQEVFEPEECYDIVSHFHTVYISNLPLIHLLTFSAYKLKLRWPYNFKGK